MTYYVYWLYLLEDEDIYKSGYVGITNNIPNRMSKHRRRFGNFKYKVIFTGTVEQAYSLELHLRPYHGIGWNKIKGGLQFGTIGPMKDRKHSVETIEKIKTSNLGQKRSKETCDKIRARPISEETKAKISESSKGRLLSAESKAKVSEALRNRPITEERRKRASEGVRKSWETRPRKMPRKFELTGLQIALVDAEAETTENK